MNRDSLLKRNSPFYIAGPCSISSEKQILANAKEIKKLGIPALRAQLWKPRTNPRTFQGVGEKGLEWVLRVKKTTSLIIAMEVTAISQIKLVENLADILWIGARNMQNYELLKAVSRANKPVLLKRGLIATLDEWLGAAEYVGKEKVILCERGIRTGADSMRFTLDLNTALRAKFDYNMPVLVDPSHSSGRRDMVENLALAGIASGLDGLIIEARINPENEPVDREQTVDINTLQNIIDRSNRVYDCLSHDE